MGKKAFMIILGMIGISILIVFGINKYIASTTTIEYGAIPNDPLPKRFNEVTYTIPSIDEAGNLRTRTFTMDDKVEKDQIVKLFIRKGKVRKYELIQMENLPENIGGNLP
jgi:uncharacterized protein YxeA